MSDGGERLRDLLEQVRAGERSVDEALAQLRDVPLVPAATDLGFATVDHERARRCGCPEVVYCAGKTPDHAARIATEILAHSDRVLLTRAAPEHAEAVRAALPEAVWHERARCITVERQAPELRGCVALICAGTADLPVAEEAAVTLEFTGSEVERFYDIGVAGLHRLTAHVDRIREANVAVVVAGMEGALPSVVAGLVDFPVVAVPTSVGYGASFGGLAALLAMMNSCAAGVSVVNIDNGFGGGYCASIVNRGANRGR